MKYRGFSQQALVREYSPCSLVGDDISPYLNAYVALSQQARQNLEVQENLAYGPKPEHTLDFFPSHGTGLHVFIHGGYWQALSQRDSANMAPAIVGASRAFATLNYTTAPGARIGEMVDERRDALIWLAKNAEELQFDPTQVVLSGHSAGAHLASMVLSKHESAIANAGMTITETILISGIYDLEPIAQVPVNEPLQLTENEITQLSPLNHVPAEDIHYWIKVAERDTQEFIRQSREYAEHLRTEGREVSFELHLGQHHFDIILHDATFEVGAK